MHATLQLFVAGLASAHGLMSSPLVNGGRGMRCATPEMTISRRSALFGAGLAAVPMAAQAAVQVNDNAYSASNAYVGDKDYLAGSDEALARIAQKTREKAAAEKAAKFSSMKAPGEEEAALAAAQEEAKRNILLVGVGGTALSVPFFYKNLERLSTKVFSGGEDTGYGSAEDIRYRQSVAAEKAKAAADRKAGKKAPAKAKGGFDVKQAAGILGINLYGKK